MTNWLEHSVQIEVDAPIDLVWSLWSDLEQMPQWMKDNNQFVCCSKKDCCKKYKKKGINLSVVGISIKEPDRIKMSEAAELGGGRLIPIMKLADAQNNLKQEIRFIAFKR